ncbi:MAG TPA: cytochrome c biogenesis protein CcsA [Thermodesulfovibrionales bacterium]|nr:cytochrome c biogenesis protein CcsA [Thermodesulfovibrionales bacterium]
MLWIAIAALPLYLLGIWKRPFLYVGLVPQAGYLLFRGVALGRLPLVGPHDTLTFLSAAIVAFTIPFYVLLKKPLFFRSTAVLSAVLTAFALMAKQHNTPLPPVLDTVWFELHVVLAFFSYALFGIGAIIGLTCLRERDTLGEGLQYRTILVGYCCFSFSMIFGGVWAYLAWGTYWLWTPKELWTSILWLFHTLYLHARLQSWWIGNPSVILGMTGFVIVVITYLGASLLMKSSHTL